MLEFSLLRTPANRSHLRAVAVRVVKVFAVVKVIAVVGIAARYRIQVAFTQTAVSWHCTT